MDTCTVSRVITAECSSVWAALSDFQKACDNFLPARSSESVGLAVRGVGAARRLHFKSGASMVERVVEWHEGSHFRFVLEHHSAPFTDAVMVEAVERVPPLGDALQDRTRITFTFTFKPSFGCIGRWILAPIIKYETVRTVLEIVDNLEWHLAHGGKKDPGRY